MVYQKMKIIIDGPGGKLKLIILRYQGRQTGKLPGILWIHGGGYVIGFAGMVYASMGKALAKRYGDETLAYVQKLNEAGIDAHVDVFHGNTHAFDALVWTKNAKEAKQKLMRAAEKYMG